MKIFDAISKRLGVDVDKVVFDKDKKEEKKLERALAKETMKVRTKLIEN